MKIIGHRGAKGLAPENTLQGFQKALDHHVDEIELDVRVTQDGVVALLHDPFVTDPAGNEVGVLTHTYAELCKHKRNITTLNEAIIFINRRVPIIIEVKPKVETKQTIAIIKQCLAKGWVPTDFRLASFDQKVLRDLHRHLPEVPKIVNERWSGTRATWRARQVNTKRLSMRSWWLWRGFLAPMHRRGWQISPYTLNDPAQARKWFPYLYGVITDYPDLFEK
jgi:glycerophosphoryl diester phosphodiesterase